MNVQTKLSPVSADYDPETDVLYVTLGDPIECEGDGLENGVELDYAVADGKPCAATVVGFHRHRWEANVAGLAQIISGHLNIVDQPVAVAIRGAVGRRNPQGPRV